MRRFRLTPIPYPLPPLSSPPRIGFVCLGCPKALVDSERILTHLRAEGYDVVGTYEDADLVVVNTCGFIDDAVHESLDAIGEALARNGKVIVTGCLGARPETITDVTRACSRSPARTRTRKSCSAVHEHLPPPHDPFVDLVPPQGIRLTPRHYAYLKISEGCNHRCSFCIIPSMRGDLASRPIGDVMREAERLVKAGVKELLVISQDTSAYGVDLKYATGFWGGKPVKARFVDLARALGIARRVGAPALRVSVPARRRRDPADGRGQGAAVPRHPVPARQPARAQADEAPRARGEHARAHPRWREICPTSRCAARSSSASPARRTQDFELLLDWLREAQLDRVGCFKYSPVEGAAANALPDPVPEEVKEERLARFMEVAAAISAEKLAAKVGQRMRVLVDRSTDDGAIARSAADAPEIDGVVRIARPGKKLQPGDWADVEITGADAYDLSEDLARLRFPGTNPHDTSIAPCRVAALATALLACCRVRVQPAPAATVPPGHRRRQSAGGSHPRTRRPPALREAAGRARRTHHRRRLVAQYYEAQQFRRRWQDPARSTS